MKRIIATLSISLLLISMSLQAQGQQQNLRGKGRRFKKQIEDREQANSFTVAFPMGLLSDSANSPIEKNWRSPAVRSQELYDRSEDGKPYAYLSKAQDQEDIWLYENWFYGLKGNHRKKISRKFADYILYCSFRRSNYGVRRVGWQTVFHVIHV